MAKSLFTFTHNWEEEGGGRVGLGHVSYYNLDSSTVLQS